MSLGVGQLSGIVRFGKREVSHVHGQLFLGKLGKEPLKKIQAEERVKLQPLLVNRLPGKDLRPGEARILGLTDKPPLREGAGKSTRKGRLALQHGPRELAVDHRIGEDEPAARFKHPVNLPEGLPLLR